MLSALFFAAFMMAAPSDQFTERVLRFEKAWDPFVRQYFGCEPHVVTDANTCKPGRAVLDRAAYGRARLAAMELFQLGER
jgi:hypothetical protein